MRIQTIAIYEFNELTDEAKENAIIANEWEFTENGDFY
jgi:hypothetical protein